ncbi:MAG: 16S rRNA (cytidine(1402)-2'-O)-methyltransferase [Gammaproteobacteria bacterium]|nr:16S rRNA (cytidine(1402)-2'-O)-methyltransferase [Gammaproteobacteria bacterium]
MNTGRLFVVSTPIGNIEDMTFRAVKVLQSVDMIAAEDTRHSRRLLNHYGISKSCVAFHEHNETSMTSRLLNELQSGKSIALISDAGTPLIRDPGFQLVRAAKTQEIDVVPIPGCCAAIAALSASGLATDRFLFAGFPPRTQSARQAFLQSLAKETGTVILYESSHRIRECLGTISDVFPGTRQVVIARELTKQHESIQSVNVATITSLFENNPYAEKGEFVILIEGHNPKQTDQTIDQQCQVMLKRLLDECSLKTAVELTTELTGAKKKQIYQMALQLKKQN